MRRNSWVEALKLWNKDNEKYCIPKKGTPAYKEVQNIRDELKKDIPKKTTKKTTKAKDPDPNNLKDMKEYKKILVHKLDNGMINMEDFKKYMTEVNKQIRKLEAEAERAAYKKEKEKEKAKEKEKEKEKAPTKVAMSEYERKIKQLIPGIVVNGDRYL